MSHAARAQRKRARRHFFQEVYDDQEGRCAMCGHRHFLTLHHLVALEDDGPNTRDNLIGLCRPCHLMWHGAETPQFGCRDSLWRPLPILHISEPGVDRRLAQE